MHKHGAIHKIKPVIERLKTYAQGNKTDGNILMFDLFFPHAPKTLILTLT